ncbi:uncharacterized protein LOC129914129 [Episyrphus balteatus]|uniref:uncharacterized protein LOC129914129 n=1 Tax=Episyrphus balteatus TaxID=286459 RepID=UPI0024863E2E|nr:uncharacterized protein LOC129914129 [Episyrphus balteatus]
MKPKNPSKRFLLSGLVLICINFVQQSLCNDFERKNENTTTTTTTERCDNNDQQMVWSRFLEEYTVSQQTNGSRTAKVLPNPGLVNPNMINPPTPMNFMSDQNYHRYIPTNNIYITKRIGEAMELEPHMRPPAKVINPPHRQNGMPSGFGGQMQQQPNHQVHPQQHIRAVSENDLYLLGAIEKLVYRVDYLESRVRRSEQLIYYLMAGNNQKEVRDPCPVNFTRISDACYFINSDQQVNWKTANSACKSVNSYLAEFEKVSENEELIAHLLNQQVHRGRDFWLGGLNPGLLWIWANSAKPVNPNMNLTSIANNLQQETDNATNTGGSSNKTESNKILNNTMEIKGQGRCLRLSYNPAKHSYFYYGQECTSRHHYVCEYEDKTLDNKIKKISRELRLDKMSHD